MKRDNFDAAGEEWSVEDEEAFKKPIREKYDAESSAYFSSARLWDDGVIEPSTTRDVLARGLEVSKNVGEFADSNYGVFRM